MRSIGRDSKREDGTYIPRVYFSIELVYTDVLCARSPLDTIPPHGFSMLKVIMSSTKEPAGYHGYNT